MNRGNNTEEHWNDKHIIEYHLTEPYDFEQMTKPENALSDHKVGADIIKENQDAVKIKSVLELGCAAGFFCNYLKEKIVPSFEIEGWDFGELAIKAAIKRSKHLNGINFYKKDFLTEHIEKDYGFICSFQTIEHVEEGKNYELINHILEHCEYFIVGTVDTEDDCFGEHISHYKIDTFEKKGYPVLWKEFLSPIQMPDGTYHYFMNLIRGKL